MNKLTYIDDCQLDHFILKKILTRFGSPYEVKCTSTANAVLYMLSQYRLNKDKLPDIILLDIHMAKLDPWDFLDSVKEIYPALIKPVEIYILSATRTPDEVERIKQYDFVKAYILKPITREVLQRLIRQNEASQTILTSIMQN